MTRKHQATILSPVKPLNMRMLLRIGMWNVQSLYIADKLDNLIKETSRLESDIVYFIT